MIRRLKQWWRLRKYRRQHITAEKARLRAEIWKRERIRLERIHPDRETLPLAVWLRELARHLRDAALLRFYPLWLLRRRVEAEP